MKTIRLFSLFLIVVGLSGIMSCKKDKPNPILGTWLGTYTASNNTYYLSFVIKSANKVDILYEAGKVGDTGSWNLVGSTFTVIVNNGSVLYKAVLNTQDLTLSQGTWGFGPSDNDGGTWTMTKQ